eukprot:GHVT01104532.1.p2 GENE.GHVT01104532.1~~GHVT01104532.1.p2  ORF type:complete len:259 (+),score=23.64 GHVT01104532.1:4057-4833(+)
MSGGSLHYKTPVEVLPETERTLALLAEKKRQEELEKEEEAARAKVQQEKEVEKQKKEQEENARKLELRKRLEEKERKRREEEEQRNRLEGGLERLILRVKANEPLLKDISFTGFRLDSVKLRLLVQEGLTHNRVLLSLDLSRRNLGDQDGEILATMLETNRTLQNLSVEGNFFARNTAEAFGRALKVNPVLRCLDIENNCLTGVGKDQTGIVELARSLRVNRGLRVLNLRNNVIDSVRFSNACGAHVVTHNSRWFSVA